MIQRFTLLKAAAASTGRKPEDMYELAFRQLLTSQIRALVARAASHYIKSILK